MFRIEQIFRNWTFFRFVRLLFGLIVIYEAGRHNTFILYMLGGFLFFHALLNISCASGNCAGGQCEIDEHKTGKMTGEEGFNKINQD